MGSHTGKSKIWKTDKSGQDLLIYTVLDIFQLIEQVSSGYLYCICGCYSIIYGQGKNLYNWYRKIRNGINCIALQNSASTYACEELLTKVFSSPERSNYMSKLCVLSQCQWPRYTNFRAVINFLVYISYIFIVNYKEDTLVTLEVGTGWVWSTFSTVHIQYSSC